MGYGLRLDHYCGCCSIVNHIFMASYQVLPEVAGCIYAAARGVAIYILRNLLHIGHIVQESGTGGFLAAVVLT